MDAFAYIRLGEILRSRGYVTEEQLQAALNEGHKRKKRLGKILTELGMVTEDQITDCLAEQFGYPVVNPLKVIVEQQAIGLIDPDFAVAHNILPYSVDDDHLDCVMSDPLDMDGFDGAAHQSRKLIRIALAPPGKLAEAILKAYGRPVSENGKKRTRKVFDHQADRRALLRTISDISA